MDLALITDDWPFDENNEQNNIRKIKGIDGCLKLQIRFPNGILQWEIEGRPDGGKPHGCETFLDYCMNVLGNLNQQTQKAANELNVRDYLIDELGEELQAYDRRRQVFMLIRDYKHAKRDAAHGLAIIDFVRECGDKPSTTLRYERQRPTLIADQARAQAFLDLQDGQFKHALLALTRGIRAIEKNFQRLGIGSEVQQCEDRTTLIDFRRSLREHCHVPMTDGELLQSLHAEQKVAIKSEDYEMAGRLRDKITRLRAKMGGRR